MTERMRALELLLGTMDDYLGSSPWGSIWQGYSRSMPGQAPSHRSPCDECSSTGRVIPSGRACVACAKGQALGTHPCVPCPGCKGAGRRWVDGYTGAAVEHVEARRSRQPQGAARARSHGVTATGLEEHAGRWELAQHRQDGAGSYAALRRALAGLAARDPRAFSVVVAVHMRSVSGDLSAVDARRLRRGMAQLSANMPRPIRLPVWLAERLAAEERNGKATDLRANGASKRQVSRELGLRARHRRQLA